MRTACLRTAEYLDRELPPASSSCNRIIEMRQVRNAPFFSLHPRASQSGCRCYQTHGFQLNPPTSLHRPFHLRHHHSRCRRPARRRLCLRQPLWSQLPNCYLAIHPSHPLTVLYHFHLPPHPSILKALPPFLFLMKNAICLCPNRLHLVSCANR